MLSYEENLPTAGEDHDYVRIAEPNSQHSHNFFHSKNLVESFSRVEFVNQNDLSAVLDHAMTGKACEGEDDLLWLTFKELVQL